MSDERKRGAVILLISAVAFSQLNVFVRMVGALPVMEIIFFRNLLGALGAWLIVRQQKQSLHCAKKDLPLLSARCILGFLAMYCSFYAAANAAQADVSTLTKMAPFITIGLAAVVLKEKITVYQVVAMVLAFSGMLIVVGKLSFDSKTFPLLMAVMCAVISAVVNIVLRKLGGRVSPAAVVFYFSLVSALCALPIMLPSFVIMALVPAHMVCMSFCGSKPTGAKRLHSAPKYTLTKVS